MDPSIQEPLNYYVYVWFNYQKLPIYVGSGTKLRWRWIIGKYQGDMYCRLVINNHSEVEVRKYEKELIKYLAERGYDLLNKVGVKAKIIPSLNLINNFEEVFTELISIRDAVSNNVKQGKIDYRQIDPFGPRPYFSDRRYT